MARLYDSEMGNRIDGRELNRNGDLSSDIVTRYFPGRRKTRKVFSKLAGIIEGNL